MRDSARRLMPKSGSRFGFVLKKRIVEEEK
jgi:hypothetical protein